MKCARCSAEVQESSLLCTSCGLFAGFSNVRGAERNEEVSALEDRYRQALEDAKERNALERVKEFEAAIRDQSQVVIAMDSGVLFNLATGSIPLFSNYQSMVRAGLRRPALLPNDQRRMAVDGKLWGTFGSEIRYGALSLDRRGLSSYGEFFATLRNLNIEDRATVLSTNSFDFVERTPGELPLGHRSNWKRRHLVAVAKCAHLISEFSEAKTFPAILMTSGATRANDEFIEVHIYGPFDFQAIESIGNHSIQGERDLLLTQIIRDYAVRAGIIWQ